MLQNENIICISTMRWDFLWTRKQRFMDMLADRGNKIIYVEPICSITNLWKRLNESRSGVGSRIREVKKNLLVLSPSLMLPAFGRFEILDYMNHRLLAKVIIKLQSKLRFDLPILWVYSYSATHILDLFPRKLLIYDCVDEMSAYPGVRSKSLVIQMERKLIEDADIVFTSAKGLYETKKQYNTNTFFVPNGVDVQHFAKVQNDSLEIPEEMKQFRKPILGFIGAIRPWVDLDLIKYIAQANQEWTVVLIGPVAPELDLSLFSEVRNVHFLGRKSLGVLPNYIKAFDVCLSVFRANELSKTVNPLKVYEYLAAGKPVVSVDMPEVRHLNNVIYLSKSYDDFVSRVRVALAENNSRRIAERMKVAKDYSWEKLFSTLCQKIDTSLSSIERARP